MGRSRDQYPANYDALVHKERARTWLRDAAWRYGESGRDIKIGLELDQAAVRYTRALDLYTQINQVPNPDARSLFEELANRIDGAALGPTSGGPLEHDIEWHVWHKLSTMIRQVLRGPDLIEQPRLVEGQTPKHAFTRAERNSGSQWNGPPEETCWFCGTDPRNSIHEIEAIPVENFYELVAIAFDVPRDIAKGKLVRALFVRPDLKQREDHAQTSDRSRDDRDDKPDKG